jgi:hypothetical protein
MRGSKKWGEVEAVCGFGGPGIAGHCGDAGVEDVEEEAAAGDEWLDPPAIDALGEAVAAFECA